MNNKAKSFVVIMISIAIFVVLLRVVILNIIKFNIEQNESSAQSTLKLIAIALENYAKDNQGAFPSKISVLTLSNSKYLDKDYISLSPVQGYNYNCSRLEQSGYNCSAIPVNCNLSGKMNYTVSTGNLFVSEKCGKKE